MVKPQAANFIRKRRNSNARKLFIKVVRYFIFCYQKLKQDQRAYSVKYCSEKTSYTLEDYLKIRFVTDYLQQRSNKLEFSSPQEILMLEFNYETEKEYFMDEKLRSDKVDIIVSNLGLERAWNDINKEDYYFAFECKRLLNTGKNREYLTDTKKFTERSYTTNRFPFNGMMGFVQKSSISIVKITEDLNKRLKTDSSIDSFSENGNVLMPFKIADFEFCWRAKHRHKDQTTTIEVFHLLFDYSEMIVD